MMLFHDGSNHELLSFHDISEDQHIIAHIEAHMSDGTIHVSDTMSDEIAQIFYDMHPSIFSTENHLKVL